MVWRLVKWAGKWLGLGLIAALAVVAGLLLVLKQYGAESAEALPQNLEMAPAASEPTPFRDGRLTQRVTINDPVLGRIGFVVSLPDPLPDRALPVVVMLGGLGTGLETIRHLPSMGENAVIGYDWPIPRKAPEGVGLLWEATALYQQAFKAPGQIDAAVAWAAAQPWSDRDRVTLLTFSLGAIIAPAAQRLMAARGLPVGWTVLAYGGADLGGLARSHPEIEADWLRPPLGGLANWLFHPLDPAEHLPHLSGRFLVIGAADDRLIPERSARLMRELTPEPKQLVQLEGRHIGVGGGQEALRQRILAVTEDWLLRENAINPR